MTELFGTLAAMSVCVWVIVTGMDKIGACSSLTGQIREVWAEALAAILALLLAARGNGAPPAPPPDA